MLLKNLFCLYDSVRKKMLQAKKLKRGIRRIGHFVVTYRGKLLYLSSDVEICDIEEFICFYDLEREKIRQGN